MARPGSAILLHDTLPKDNAAEIYLENLEQLFKKIREKGLHTVPVDSLFDLVAYRS
jgi:hypothetical protein